MTQYEEIHPLALQLVENGKCAMRSAIEIYNKPHFGYRNECGSILLINAWDLLLKALLTQAGQPIFESELEDEKKGVIFAPINPEEYWEQPSSAIGFNRAFGLVEENDLLGDLDPLPVRLNLNLLSDFRHKSIHYYNDALTIRRALLHLAQANVINFVDLLKQTFMDKLEAVANWHTHPLLLNVPLTDSARRERELEQIPSEQDNWHVKKFLEKVEEAEAKVVEANQSSNRLMIPPY